MSDEGWEERMAARARARREAQPQPQDPHADHHSHSRGNHSTCTCGIDLGVFSIVITDDMPDPDTLSCWICGEQGVVGPYRPDDPNWRLA